MDPARFVFDETGTATTMTRRDGRTLSGTRLVAAVPHGHWRTTTFIAGRRQTGIVAPLVLDRPMTGPALAPVSSSFWRRWSRPATSSPYNLSAPGAAGQAIAAAGASIRYLPSYSPDPNPIEQLFAKKALNAAARTRDELWQATGLLLAGLPSAACINSLNRCGYGSS